MGARKSVAPRLAAIAAENGRRSDNHDAGTCSVLAAQDPTGFGGGHT